MFSDLDRQQLIVPWTVFAGALTAAGTETTKDELVVFRIPTNGVIVGWSASYVNEAGTTPSLDLTLERGTTVLDTLAQLTTDEAVVTNTGLDIACATGENLNIKGDANNTDNAFDGLLIVLYWRPFQG